MAMAFVGENGKDDEAFVLDLVKYNENSDDFGLQVRQANKTEIEKEFTKTTWYRIEATPAAIFDYADEVFKKFGSYSATKNNCQSYLKEFLHGLGIEIWFSGVPDGFKNNRAKRLLIWGPAAMLGTPVLGFGSVATVAFLGVTAPPLLLGTFIVGAATPLATYILTENREFSTAKRNELFEEAKKHGINVLDERKGWQKTWHRVMGW